MKQHFFKVILSLLFFLLANFLFSQELEEINAENKQNTEISIIRAIHFTGLKKTRDSYLQNVLKKYKGQNASKEILADIETSLQIEGLFSEISIEKIEIENGETELNINVKEKITFIPLPFASYSDGKAMGGLIVMDTNALGCKDFFMVGGIFSASTMTGIASISKPAKDLFHPGVSFSVAAAKGNSEVDSLDDEVLFDYDRKNFSAGFSIKEIWECLSFDIGMNYSQKYTGDINVRDSSSLLDTSFITDSKILTFSSSIGIKKVDWNGYFLSEKNASLSGNLHFIKDSFSEAEDKSYHGEAIGVNITLQQAIIPSIRLLSSVAAAYSHNSSFYNWFSGNNVGISILPDNFSTPKIAATTIGFESMMFRTSWSLFSAYALYECTWLENSDNEIVFEHGPETGIKMYLSKIAFPAFAFGICYNISHARMQYAISFGASM